MTITFDCQERSKLSAEVAQVSALLEAGSPVRSYFLRPEAMPIYDKIFLGICRPIGYVDIAVWLLFWQESREQQRNFEEHAKTQAKSCWHLGKCKWQDCMCKTCRSAVYLFKLSIFFFCDIASRRSLQTNELQSCKRQSEWIVGSCWDMLGHSEMMSRPVSIGTGVCEIIGGSVQTVFAAGGTSILLDPFAIELRFQVHNSVNDEQRSRPNLQDCWNHLCICIILYFYHVLPVNDKRVFKFELFVCKYWLRLFRVVQGCLETVWKWHSKEEAVCTDYWRLFWVGWVFGSSLEMAFIRTRFEENSLNFCCSWGKQDLTQGPWRTVSSTGASVDCFWQHAACSKKEVFSDRGSNGMQNWVQSTGHCSWRQTQRGRGGIPWDLVWPLFSTQFSMM